MLRLCGVVAILILCLGCAGKQHLRLVSSDVYDGVNSIKADSKQVEEEANKRYDKLYLFASDILKENQTRLELSDADISDTLKDMQEERAEFRKVTGLNRRISLMSDDVLWGLGWEEGPRDPLPTAGALLLGAGTGAAIAAAF